MPSDFLLEIDGIKGESHDSKHKDTIEIDSFSWGNTNSGSHGAGAGGGAGKVSFQDVHFTTHVNKASPKLMQFCATGEHIKKAVLFVRKQGKDQQEAYTVTLEDLLVSSYQSGGSNGSGSVPVDQFSLNFTKIKFEYKPQKADGSLDGAITGTWNVKTNKTS
ncbi:Hcp1 family type VI secretion system effector [Bosea caraganae]|uniref:Hcp1 family type VI secretion system effector n=1 Tax=Bosea caraganae TaxID=2763117 RepID=A0A370L8H1_9HYPH|nr:type VI secretion system tube protein Hcp [Bosea caraganae]RDJ24961.1 Hcp1 family type VI secretion system effector [Bosea caraganae]RDJ26072.1 Hcp1 family type VI secretion system effector [Bosea caraganae]